MTSPGTAKPNRGSSASPLGTARGGALASDPKAGGCVAGGAWTPEQQFSCDALESPAGPSQGSVGIVHRLGGWVQPWGLGPSRCWRLPGTGLWAGAQTLPWLNAKFWQDRLPRCLSVFGLLASLLGSQSLASSSPQGTEVRFLLPAGGLWAPLSDGLRRGYSLAIDQAQVCGQPRPALDLAWVSAALDRGEALASRPRTRLLIAPPAAALESYGVLAEQRRLTVLLPLQRGDSLARLPQLRGADHLWPLLAPRGLGADRLAHGLLAARLRRVLVVRDGGAGQKQLAERFLETLLASGGTSAGVEPGPQLIDGRQPAVLAQLRQDVDWAGPQVLAVFSESTSPLARAVRSSRWPAVLTLAWPFAELEPLANPQVGVDASGRGEGWSQFARAFEGRWGYGPGVAEAAGYDAGQLVSLAAIRSHGEPGWDLQWLKGHGRPQELCAAIAARRLGRQVRPQGAASHLDGSAGSPPSAALQLSHLPARP